MTHETIKNYVTSDVGASQSLVTLEMFIGDMDNAELADDSTIDTSDAVTAINGLIFSLETRDAKIEELKTALRQITRQPLMPLPDPIAHSWEAFGQRANYALRDCRHIASAALKE